MIREDEILRFRTKLFYGLGEVGEGVKTAALETFLFFYYVQVLGLSGVLTGGALFIALLFDAVSDPLVGAWSDRTRTRLGRRHPYLYAAPIPLALALYGLFSPPDLESFQLFAWLTSFTILARVAMTFYFVPHMALGAELSRDFGERVSVGGYRVFFGYVGRILALALGFSIFFTGRPGFANGQLDPTAYPPFAMVAGLLVIVFVVGSALGTQGAALRLASARPPAAPGTRGLLLTLRLASRSPSFKALFGAILVLSIYNGVQGSLALHMNTYFWRLPPTQVQFLFYASMLGFMAGIALARPAAALFDKKAAYMGAVGGSVVVSTAPTILRLLGVLPENGDPILLPILLSSSFGAGLIGSVAAVVSAAMVADLADEFDFAHTDRAEGLFFGVTAFCRKASLGLGGAIAGVVIDLIRFPRQVAPTAVPVEALERLGLVYGPIVLGVICAGLTIMIPYRLDRRRHGEIAQLLASRL